MAKNLPKIIYGTAWKKERTKDLVVKAVLRGFTAIDTGKHTVSKLGDSQSESEIEAVLEACQPKHYREDLVGEALQELYDKHEKTRENLWLQTKFTSITGQDRSKPLPYDPSLPIPSQILASLKTSLRNLRTTYIDSYILHSPFPALSDTLTAWQVLCELQDAGTVSRIGVSNCYDVDVIRSMGEVRRVEVVQNRWYEGNGWDKDVVKYCRENGIMYQSFWTLTGSPSLLKHRTVLALAQELQCTPAQIIFRLAQANGITPLAGSTNETRMRDGVAAEQISVDKYMSGDDVKALQELLFK